MPATSPKPFRAVQTPAPAAARNASPPTLYELGVNVLLSQAEALVRRAAQATQQPGRAKALNRLAARIDAATLPVLALLVAGAAAALVPADAQAQTIGVHLATAHFGAPAGVEYHSVTPGLYLRTDAGLTVGAYRNSGGTGSAYVGWTWDAWGGAVSLTAGGVTGYSRARVAPLLVPSARVWLTERTALRIAVLPKPRSDRAWGVHAAVEVTL